MTLTPGHLTSEQRNVLRPVALAYRRAYRAGASSEGECHDAALREYRRVCSDAPAEQRAWALSLRCQKTRPLISVRNHHSRRPRDPRVSIFDGPSSRRKAPPFFRRRDSRLNWWRFGP